MNEQTFRKNRQKRTRKVFIVLLAMYGVPLTSSGQTTQKKSSEVNYSVKSNILNPDTLRGDQKKIFWHFVEYSHEEIEALEPLFIKTEFEKLGIYTTDNDRFLDAYIFFDTDMIYHKKSCEQWEAFKDLKP